MWKLSVISAVCSVVGYAAVHFAFFATPQVAPEVHDATPQAAPVVLAEVVDVTDTEGLLDPQPRQLVGVPFDAAEPISFNSPVGAKPIPPTSN